jgi:O-antigen/teichoic acid export membrane protein
MAISVTNIARNSLKFTSVQVISTLISMPISIYMATILVPEEYGTYGFLGLWLTYAGLIGLGITGAGYREVPVLLGRGDEKGALRIQNISITSEMLYSILPMVVILGASFFYTERVFKFGLIIVAISFGITRLVNYWSAVNFLRQNFNIAVKGRLIANVATPLLILACVNWLRVYALLIAPIGAAVISGIYYWRKGPIDFHFTFDWKETVRLIKIGVILQGGTLVLWGFRLADRTIIASALPSEQLGLYVYAMGFIMMALAVLEDFGNVLQPILYKEAGKADSIYEGFKDTKRIAVYIALGGAILIPISQLGFHLMVSLITPKYIDSIPIFYVLSYNLYLFSLVIIPSQILYSSIVNKQKIFLLSYSVGLALNVAFSIVVIRLGYGVVGVAWVTICTQGLVTFILYRFIKGYLFTDTKEFIRFLGRILVPFMVTIPFYFLHNFLCSVTLSAWNFTGISLAAQVIIWGLVIGIFYREYFSINNIKAMIKEISLPMRNKPPGDKR